MEQRHYQQQPPSPSSSSKEEEIETLAGVHLSASLYNRWNKENRWWYGFELVWCDNDGEIASDVSSQSKTHSKRFVCSHSIIQYLLKLNKDTAPFWITYG